jgi:DUF4097 and DUF4098 domain-containing protein YvlB
MVLAAAAALSACNLDISNQVQATSEWKKDYTLAPGGILEIRNTNGLIEIDPSEGTEVHVTAERIAKAGTDEDARKAADGIEIRESVSGSSITLDAKISMSGMFTGSRQVKFHVRAPKGTVLTLSNTNGDINVRNMTGELRLDSTNGRIRGTSLEGTTRAETTNGVIELDYAAIGEGGITADTTNGRVVITLPKSVKARINARVTNGAISTENLSLETSESSKRRLTATLNGGGPEIRVETTNGAVSLRGK